MIQQEKKLCSDLDERYDWIFTQLSDRYVIDVLYGEKCFIVNSNNVEAVRLCKFIAPERSHSLVLEYAFIGDGCFTEDGDLFPIEDYSDKGQMLVDMLAEIEQ